MTLSFGLKNEVCSMLVRKQTDRTDDCHSPRALTGACDHLGCMRCVLTCGLCRDILCYIYYLQ